MPHQTIEEFKTLLHQEDYSQLSRKLLDVSVENNLESNVEQLIYNFRKSYLDADSKDVLKQDADIILNAISNSTLAEPENYPTTNLVCDAQNISKQYVNGGSPFHLQPLNVELKFGEITGIVGENGNGKTTLLRILAGELSSDTGEITYPALNADDKNWYKVKNQFVFIPQRIPSWHGSLVDNLRFFASIHGFTSEENTKQISYILFRLGLEKFKHLKWSELSSGYRLRFELAKAIMWRPKLILLDEPLANLDINAQQLFLQDLKFFVKSTKFPLSIILSSQQLHEVESISDNIIFIKQGKTIYNGNQLQFGVEGHLNTFELTSNATREQLQAIFKDYELKVENAGTTTLVSLSKQITSDVFLSTLLSNKITLTYYRDISHSTRKLFHKDI
jgi:ABC-2 type transport system ATP-binding protein